MIYLNNSFIIPAKEIDGIIDEIQELIDNEWLIKDGENYILNSDNFYLIDNYYKRLLGFPQQFEGKIKILLNGGGINIDGAKIELEFYNYNSQGVLERTNGKIENGLIYINAYFFTPKNHHFELLNLIEIYNDHSNKIDRYSSFIQFGRIKKMQKYDDILFDSYLSSQDIIVPSKLKMNISVNEETEEVSICPEIEDVNYNDFIDEFERRPIVSSDYRINNDGKIKRVFIPTDSEELKNELEKFKSKSVYSGLDLKELVNNPSKYFNLELTNIEELFGDRVIGLSPFIPVSIPIVNVKKTDWIPGFKIDEEYILINDKIEYLALKNALVLATEENLKFIFFKGKKVSFEIAKVIERLSKLIFEDKTPPSIEELKNNEVLIVKDNIEEVEYSADFSSFEILTSATLTKVNNLKPNFQLKDYQIAGVSWLQEVKNKLKSTGALLADDMGLGKTLQILYFIESIYQSEKINKPSLIVAPSSLLENWINEYKSFFNIPSLDFIIIDKNKLSILEKERKNPSATLYLTTYEGMRINSLHFCTVDWAIVALDEAQKIKNPSALVTHVSKGIKADFKVAMTGTPVENVLLDLWTIIDFCVPGLLGSAKGFNRGIQSGELKTQEIREKISPIFIRRLKSDVAKNLPKKNEIVIKEEMPAKQLDFYNQVINQLTLLKEKNQLTKTLLLRSIHELRLISDHHELTNDELINDSFDFNSSAKINIIERLLKEIKNKEEKVILFTDKRKMQHLLRKYCEIMFNISPSIINGDVPSSAQLNQNVKTRQKLVDDFQGVNGFNIIIMSPLAAGFGLNVVGANNVIHYSRHWNPAKENQATDRVYRIGQIKDVNIYYPMAILPNGSKSFDEILDNRLLAKKALADDLLFPTEQISVTNEELFDDLIPN